MPTNWNLRMLLEHLYALTRRVDAPVTGPCMQRASPCKVPSFNAFADQWSSTG